MAELSDGNGTADGKWHIKCLNDVVKEVHNGGTHEKMSDLSKEAGKKSVTFVKNPLYKSRGLYYDNSVSTQERRVLKTPGAMQGRNLDYETHTVG